MVFGGLLPGLLGACGVLLALLRGPWPWLLLLPAAALPPVLWFRFGPLGRARGRRRYVLCAEGLLVSSRTDGQLAVPWAEVTDELAAALRPAAASRRLLRSLGERRVASAPPRAAGGVLVLLLLVLAGALGTLAVLLLGLFEKEGPPQRLRDLAAVCEEERALPRAAPYREEGPHPVVVFGDGAPGWLTTAGEGRPEPDPAEIQLVACSSRVGRLSEEPAMTCHYQANHVVRRFPARYRVEVYQARTRRHLGGFTLDATEDPGHCALSEVFPEGMTEHERDLTPSEEDYREGLAPFVTGR